MSKEGRNLLLVYNRISGRRGLWGRRDDQVRAVVQWFAQQDWTVEPYVLPPVAVGPAGLFTPPTLPEMDPGKYRAVIAAGGDGTLHWVANALLTRGTDLPMAVLPWGTSNDYAANLGISNHQPLEEMLTDTLTALTEECFVRFDVGEAGGRYFINLLGFGLLTNVAYEVHPRYKNRLGRLAYILNVIPNLKSYRPFELTLTTTEGKRRETMLMVLVQNGLAGGGFKRIAPRASCIDSRFDVVGFRAIPWLKMWPLLRQVLRGEHVKDPAVLYFQTDRIELTSNLTLATTMDGERGPDLPLTATVHPRSLLLVSLKNARSLVPSVHTF